METSRREKVVPCDRTGDNEEMRTEVRKNVTEEDRPAEGERRKWM